MTDSLNDPVELLDVDGGPDDDMGEWIPTPDMEDQARCFHDDVDPWEEEERQERESMRPEAQWSVLVQFSGLFPQSGGPLAQPP
jgi:hypothetical protein